MVDLWLQELEKLICEMPGGSDPVLGVWESTYSRLGVASLAAARRRCYWSYPESADVAELRPFFVLQQVRPSWTECDLQTLAYSGVIEVAYTEAADGDAVDHKASQLAFLTWTERLIQSCVDRRLDYQVPIAAIHQVIEPQRTPQAERDLDTPGSDYWWCAWHFHLAHRAR